MSCAFFKKHNVKYSSSPFLPGIDLKGATMVKTHSQSTRLNPSEGTVRSSTRSHSRAPDKEQSELRWGYNQSPVRATTKQPHADCVCQPPTTILDSPLMSGQIKEPSSAHCAHLQPQFLSGANNWNPSCAHCAPPYLLQLSSEGKHHATVMNFLCPPLSSTDV